MYYCNHKLLLSAIVIVIFIIVVVTATVLLTIIAILATAYNDRNLYLNWTQLGLHDRNFVIYQIYIQSYSNHRINLASMSFRWLCFLPHIAIKAGATVSMCGGWQPD